MTRGSILTVTSYRSGVGRTMTVANLAWLLASSGKRVLAIDWNLAAPRLAEFFHPFWPGSDPRESPGVIDALWEFVLDGYRKPKTACGETGLETLSEKAVALSCDFKRGGELHFLNVGYVQSYRVRRRLFPWEAFYAELGGQQFVENVRVALHQRYDYVVIDAPVVLDDTAALCTVALADVVLMGCTTFANEPLAAGLAASRIKALAGKLPIDRSHRVVPLLMKVEMTEMDRLNRVRERVKDAFKNLCDFSEASGMRDVLELQYVPFFAYEPTLAPFFDSANRQTSLSGQYARILSVLMKWDVRDVPQLSEREREAYRAHSEIPPKPAAFESLFESNARRELRPSTVEQGHFFVSYRRDSYLRIVPTLDQIQKLGFDVWWDEGIVVGTQLEDHLARKIQSCRAVILFVDSDSANSRWVRWELANAQRLGKPIVPIRLDDPGPDAEFRHVLEDVLFLDDPGAHPSPALEAALRRLCLESS